MISGWRKRYSEILNEFKYSEKKDKESAMLLNSILKKSNVNEKIINLVKGKTVFVIGSGPSLSTAIPKLKNFKKSIKIVLDPAVGFFRKTGKGQFFTKIKSNWVERDLSVIKNLNSIKQNFPILISVSNKSFLGNLLGKENPSDRLFGSIAAEAISVINGADIIRTHNVEATKEAITIASKLSK